MISTWWHEHWAHSVRSIPCSTWSLVSDDWLAWMWIKSIWKYLSTFGSWKYIGCRKYLIIHFRLENVVSSVENIYFSADSILIHLWCIFREQWACFSHFFLLSACRSNSRTHIWKQVQMETFSQNPDTPVVAIWQNGQFRRKIRRWNLLIWLKFDLADIFHNSFYSFHRFQRLCGNRKHL